MSLLLDVFRDLVSRRSHVSDDGPAGDPGLRVFIAHDSRQAAAYSVAHHSLAQRCSVPLAITPLRDDHLPLQRAAPSPLAFGRFLVPWLTGFRGWALFMDADTLVLDDVAGLFALADPRYAVMLTPSIEPAHWTSVMLFNCAHPACRALTPEFLDDDTALASTELLYWMDESVIGALPDEWNHTVAYDLARDDARLAHFPLGVPLHPETDGCEYSAAWHEADTASRASWTWLELFRGSVHAVVQRNGRIVPMAMNDPAARLGARVAPVAPSSLRPPAPPRAGPRFEQALARVRALHERADVFAGNGLHRHAANIAELTARTGSTRVLDYGCGKAEPYAAGVVVGDGAAPRPVTEAWRVREVTLFDPAVAEHAARPLGLFDGVVCIDVLEYCDEADVGWLLRELFEFAVRFVYLSLYGADEPGEGAAPGLVRDPDWWRARIVEARRQRPQLVFVAMYRMADGRRIVIEG